MCVDSIRQTAFRTVARESGRNVPRTRCTRQALHGPETHPEARGLSMYRDGRGTTHHWGTQAEQYALHSPYGIDRVTHGGGQACEQDSRRLRARCWLSDFSGRRLQPAHPSCRQSGRRQRSIAMQDGTGGLLWSEPANRRCVDVYRRPYAGAVGVCPGPCYLRLHLSTIKRVYPETWS